MAQGAGYTFHPDTVTGTQIRDVSGYFHHGTILGSAAITTDGKYDDGLNCTGGAMRAIVPATNYAVNVTGGTTISVWVKLNDTTSAVRTVVSTAASGALAWAVRASNASGNVEAVVAGTAYDAGVSIRDGAWHHLLLVVNAIATPDTIVIKVDGVERVNTTSATLSYSAAQVTLEVGRNALSGGEPLNGIVSDLKWFNDPVETAWHDELMDFQQKDLMLALYTFDDSTGKDSSFYNRNLTLTAAASFEQGLYGMALKGSGAQAAASGTVDFGGVDRLDCSGWLRIDALPGTGSKPLMAATDSAGNPRWEVLLNSTGTITQNWYTIAKGTQTVTSTNTVTVGKWARYSFNMNPTYSQVHYDTTSTDVSVSDAFPSLAPFVSDVYTLYVAGSASAGAQVTFNYMTFMQNFLSDRGILFWTGSPTPLPSRPSNVARGVYYFNETSGSTANDESPSNNDLTVTASGSFGAGVSGNALLSSGNAPVAQKTSGLAWTSAPLGFGFSADLRFKPPGSGARAVVLKGAGGEVAHVGLLNSNLWVRFFGAGGGTTGLLYATTGGTMSTNTWYHIGATVENGAFNVYLNGQHQFRESTTFHPTVFPLGTPTSLYVGGDNTDSVVADVDNLYLFDTPISKQNIAWMRANPSQFYAVGTAAEMNLDLAFTASVTSRLVVAGDMNLDLAFTASVVVASSVPSVGADTNLDLAFTASVSAQVPVVGDTNLDLAYTAAVAVVPQVPVAGDMNLDLAFTASVVVVVQVPVAAGMNLDLAFTAAIESIVWPTITASQNLNLQFTGVAIDGAPVPPTLNMVVSVEVAELQGSVAVEVAGEGPAVVVVES